jgi:hypothetical protein
LNDLEEKAASADAEDAASGIQNRFRLRLRALAERVLSSPNLCYFALSVAANTIYQCSAHQYKVFYVHLLVFHVSCFFIFPHWKN